MSESQTFGTTSRIGHDSSKFYNREMYSDVETETATDVDQSFPVDLENTIILGSAVDMSSIPSNSVHLMITSPPYNVGKEYDENLSLAKYMELLQRVFVETHRVLVDGGRACINIANVGRKPYIPLTMHVNMLMHAIGFNMRGEIIWQKGAGAGVSMAWGSWQSASNPVLRDTHEYILVYSKGSYRRKGGDSTITTGDFTEWTKSVWSMQPESAKRVGHPAPYPVDLPHRLIQLYSFRGDVVLDPFMGSGTTAVAAWQDGRRYVGFELDPKFHALATKRLDLIEAKISLF